MYHGLIIHSPTEGHLGCFQVWKIMNKCVTENKEKKQKRHTYRGEGNCRRQRQRLECCCHSQGMLGATEVQQSKETNAPRGLQTDCAPHAP